MVCQPAWGHFMPKGLGIAYIYIFCEVFGSWLYDIKYSYQIELICKTIYLNHREELNRYCYSGSEWTWE